MPKLINGPAKHAGGRPQVEIDLAQVEKMAALQATDTEIAVSLGVSRNSIKRVKKSQAYQDAIERGRTKGKLMIRQAQFRSLMSGEKNTMAMYLGKAILGQSDSSFGSTDPISEITLRVKRPPRPGS